MYEHVDKYISVRRLQCSLMFLLTYRHIYTEEAGNSGRDFNTLPAEKQSDLGWSEGEEWKNFLENE